MKRRADETQRGFTEAAKGAALIEENSQSNWELLKATLKGDVEEFVKESDLAKTQRLRIDIYPDIPYKLTVLTLVQPILGMDVLMKEGQNPTLVVYISRQGMQDSEDVYRFLPDGFTDGDRYYSPDNLVEKLFYIVRDHVSA